MRSFKNPSRRPTSNDAANSTDGAQHASTSEYATPAGTVVEQNVILVALNTAKSDEAASEPKRELVE